MQLCSVFCSVNTLVECCVSLINGTWIQPPSSNHKGQAQTRAGERNAGLSCLLASTEMLCMRCWRTRTAVVESCFKWCRLYTKLIRTIIRSMYHMHSGYGGIYHPSNFGIIQDVRESRIPHYSAAAVRTSTRDCQAASRACPRYTAEVSK